MLLYICKYPSNTESSCLLDVNTSRSKKFVRDIAQAGVLNPKECPTNSLRSQNNNRYLIRQPRKQGFSFKPLKLYIDLLKLSTIYLAVQPIHCSSPLATFKVNKACTIEKLRAKARPKFHKKCKHISVNYVSEGICLLIIYNLNKNSKRNTSQETQELNTAPI